MKKTLLIIAILLTTIANSQSLYLLDQLRQEQTPKYGPDELVINGVFDTDTDWTKETGWTINTGTGKAVADGTGSGSSADLSQATLGGGLAGTYRLTFDTVRTSGTVNVGVYIDGAGDFTNSYPTTGSHILEWTTDGTEATTYLWFRSYNFNGTIDNVSVRKKL